MMLHLHFIPLARLPRGASNVQQQLSRTILRTWLIFKIFRLSTLRTRASLEYHFQDVCGNFLVLVVFELKGVPKICETFYLSIWAHGQRARETCSGGRAWAVRTDGGLGFGDTWRVATPPPFLWLQRETTRKSLRHFGVPYPRTRPWRTVAPCWGDPTVDGRNPFRTT